MNLFNTMIADRAEFFSRIFNKTKDVVWAMNLEGKFIYVSPSVEYLRGFSVKEVLNQSAFDAIHPEDQKLVRRMFNTGLELIEKGVTRIPPGKVRLRQICKDKTIIWTEVVADYVFNKEREFLFVLGLSRDITELVKAEEEISRLKALLIQKS
jgi:PAS domain S-box-containing protein